MLRLVPVANVLMQGNNMKRWEERRKKVQECSGGKGCQYRNIDEWLPCTFMQPVNKRRMLPTVLCLSIPGNPWPVKRRLKSLIFVLQLLQRWGKGLMRCHLRSACLFWSPRPARSDCWTTGERRNMKKSFLFLFWDARCYGSYLDLADSAAWSFFWRIQW